MSLRLLGRFIALLAIVFVALQLYFALRVALMAVLDPQSTSFQRSEAWRLLREGRLGGIGWQQQWVPYARIADGLKRSVIASEDAGFVEHSGVEWEALEKAWEKNLRAQAQAAERNRLLAERAERAASRAAARGLAEPPPPPPPVQPKIVGGSTITQQLSKNLFLSGERTSLRKGQEIVITYMLEHLLGKPRRISRKGGKEARDELKQEADMPDNVRKDVIENLDRQIEKLEKQIKSDPDASGDA